MTRRLRPVQRLLLALLTLLIAWEGGEAQFRVPRTPRAESSTLRTLPPSRPQSRGTALARPTSLVLAPPTAEELQQAAPASQGLRTFTFAVERPVTQTTPTLGEYARDTEGRYVWRATITAPRAKSIGLRLGSYALPAGGALFVHSAQSPATGALTEAHNRPDSLLQIAPIASQAVELLYEFPEGTTSADLRLPFVVESAFYGFRDLHAARADEDFAQPGEPFYDHPVITLQDLACAPNVLAYPDAWKETHSTLLLIVGGTSASSGALINNTRQDGTPYVLTAAHCLNGLFQLLGDLPAVRRNAATTVFFFGFQSPLERGNIRGSEEQSLSGASLVGYSEDSEMCLLRIEGLPTDASGQRAIPTAYQPYFAGWNRSATPQGPFVGIHHPGGSTKRYNRSSDTSLQRDDYHLTYRDAFGGLADVSWYGKHWLLNAWRIGMTASGSSGSPLFDKDGLIIGALTGGASSCASPFDDRYWSLVGAWSAETPGSSTMSYLSPWLDPTGSGATTCPGLDPYAPRTIQRLSAIYPDPNVLTSESQPRPNRLRTTSTTSDGVGNRIKLPALSGTKLLGAYVVFKADGTLRARDIPQLRIRLERFAQRDGGATPLVEFASTTLGQYSRLTATGAPALGDRTLRQDTLELFFPAPDGTTLDLDEGAYLLSCLTADGSSLNLPLLGYAGGNDRGAGWTAWTHDLARGWERSRDLPEGAYWIDLLVETPQPIRLEASTESLLPPGLHAYYHAGALYLTGDALFEHAYSLCIYDLTGKRHLVHTFPQRAGGQGMLQLHLPAGQYIAVFTPAHLTKPSRSERYTLPFTHR